MAVLLKADNLAKSFGARQLFENISLLVREKERIGLIGPNGAGKSTLLKILAGEDAVDGGTIERPGNPRCVFLSQADSHPGEATLLEVLLTELEKLPLSEYERETQAEIMLGRLGFDNPLQTVATLSGGWCKRLSIGRALVQEPDLALLDEPTNHLDLDGIAWLESLLENSQFAFVMVSHDRYLLERLSTSVFEINRAFAQGCFQAVGRYSDFLEQREAWLASQQRYERSLAGHVRQEVEWLRRGPQGRRHKRKTRIREAESSIEELSALRQRLRDIDRSRMRFSATGRRTNDLIVAEGIAKTIGGKSLFAGLDALLVPGARLGIVGNNGTGKSTLLRTLTKKLEPDAGTVHHATGLRIALFDQQRVRLDPTRTLRKTLAPHGDTIEWGGRRQHVTALSEAFLFQRDQLDMPVGELSGGEQARVMLALMMHKPADVIMLDEPTNDLDIDSIEMLESQLHVFPGAVVLITHDRHMLDSVCTEVIGLHGQGRCGRYADLYQWQEVEVEIVRRSRKNEKKRKTTTRKSAGLSREEERELGRMERVIVKAEEKAGACRREAECLTGSADHERMQTVYARWHEAEAEVERLYARWAELEKKCEQSGT